MFCSIMNKIYNLFALCTLTGDATLSRHKGINIDELALHTKIAVSPSGELWRGKWQGNEIVAKILALRECSPRICRDFNDEFPRLRLACFCVSLCMDEVKRMS